MEKISELAGETIQCRDEFINEVNKERSELVTIYASRELLVSY
jgi:hypothetical protein